MVSLYGKNAERTAGICNNRYLTGKRKIEKTAL